MKIKLISITIVSLLITIGAFSASGDFLDGDIDVEIRESLLGVVYPHITLANESEITFVAEFVDDGNESYWEVNETISINLDINDDTGRETFFFPRSMVYSAILIRKEAKIMPIFPIGNLFRRFFPVIQLGKSVNVVESQIGENKSDIIEIPVQYTIQNDSIATENMVLHLLVMGILPGDLNGINMTKVIEHKAIDLTVNYISTM
jgi:hypothetical protein